MSVETADVNLQNQLSVDREAADHLFLEARTANTFSTEPVSDEQLAAIYELAKMGPTMMNNQPLRITWVRSAEAREKLAARMAEGNRAKTQSAPMVAVLSYDTDWHEHFETFFPHAPERKEMFDGNAEMRAEVAKNNAWLQAGFFIMAVRAVGLHAGPMGASTPPASTRTSTPAPPTAPLWWSTSAPRARTPGSRGCRALDAEIAVQTV